MDLEVLSDADTVARRAAALIAAAARQSSPRAAGSSWPSAAATLPGSCCVPWQAKTSRGRACMWSRWTSAWPPRDTRIET